MTNETKPISTLVIPRDIWARGGDNRTEEVANKLLRSHDGRMCCLGIYLESRGVPRSVLLEKDAPADVRPFIPEGCRWLLVDDELVNAVDELMQVNDDHYLTDDEREAELTALFLEAPSPIAVTFVDTLEANE